MSPPIAVLQELQSRTLISRQGPEKGPLLLSIGGLHGNEPAGVHALMRIEKAFKNDLIELKKGRIRAYAGNLPALQKQVRFQDFDMNRIWVSGHVNKLRNQENKSIRCEEDQELVDLLNDLEPFIQDHSDEQERIFLDLHSFSAPGGLFSLTLPNARHEQIGSVLLAPIIFGVIEQLNGTALHYFDELGFYSIGFEGGQHQDPRTIDTMESALWILLNQLEMVHFKDISFLEKHIHRLGQLTRGLPSKVQLMYRHTVYPESEFRMNP
jgi:succinylglutamate desuccinylase